MVASVRTSIFIISSEREVLRMSRFANVTDKLDFASEEERTLAYWTEIDAFQTSLKLSEGKPEFTFYDGPPFATGLPHYGHILAGTIKDTVTRYAHQTGHYVSRRFGWDCHGLPVEYEIDKKLKIISSRLIHQQYFRLLQQRSCYTKQLPLS